MYEQKKIFILGMARSGYECAKLLADKNEIFLTDSKLGTKEQMEDLKKWNVHFEQSENQVKLLDSSFDVVIKNPGVPLNHPVLLKANDMGIPVVNEMEVAYHYLPKKKTIIGITGSNGKTTTTTLIYEMFKKANLPVHLGGNIGFPLSSIVKSVKENDIVLLEISDHQLVNFKDFKTDISILTNISPTHLDFHGSYEAYKKSKAKIFDHHTPNDCAFLNAKDEESLKTAEKIKSRKEYFNGFQAYLKNNSIYLMDEKIIDISELKVKGIHNCENIMASLLVAKEFSISKEVIRDVLLNFKGVEHRIEFVKEVNGITYYNDSKSTNPVATMTALKSFNTPVLLILGGLERNQDFHDLKESLEHVTHIYAIGQTKERIMEFAKEYQIPCTKKETLKEIMEEIKKDAKEGDTVLLSPASASWDQYDKFESRGEEFKQLI